MVADEWTTAQSQSLGGREDDPIARLFIGRQSTAGYAAAMAVDAGAVWLIRRTLGRSHPKVAAALLFVGAGLRVAGTAANVSTIHSLSR